MMQIVDTVLVGVALGASLCYAVLALGPRALRRRILATIGTWLTRLPVWGVRRLGDRAQRAAQTRAGACGGCDNCGSTPAAPTSHSTEVHVSVTQIGRRATP